ncbi:hypothetical protein R515_07995 [Salmonella enterica subsp. arizonae serovar 41:z4,z23:-]|nr:hypothetical protein [Salmonella enterica]OSE59159.1 hypothetical protein R515_07995 [Salmonella enterica subsp. arizonae serovar 41:z4,z23:-]EAS8745290.1 hypothetical protein [Salmonella enterica]EAT7881991.1 hypothetical protein [Salmonella enterica]EAU0103905.1 hypothetical protein [Salmonella enterica]
MPDGGVNALSGLHGPPFYHHVFEIHHKIISFRRQKTTRRWLFFAGDKEIQNAHRISKSLFHCVIRSKKWLICRRGKHSPIKS